MFKFLKKRQDNSDRVSTQFADSTQSPDTIPMSTQQSDQQGSTYRELTRVVLRDTLRTNGIPLDWIRCEAIPRNSDHGRGGGLLIQLLILRWHDGLLLYAPLIQQQILQGMQRFDPASDHSAHVVVWKISNDCGYVRTSMPAADFWLTQPATAPGKPKFDLPPSSRDHHGDDFSPTIPADFPPTVPGDFR